MFRRLTAHGILLGSLVAAAAGGSGPATKPLRMASAVPWTVPPFQSYGRVQCDSSSNLYFDVSGMPSNRQAILKVAHDSSKYDLYTLPPLPDYSIVHYAMFSVTPSGELRVMVHAFRGTGKSVSDHSIYVFLYGSDPGNPSQIRLQSPDYFSPRSFAAFQTGAMLVRGNLLTQASQGHTGRAYSAVFQATGQMAAEIPESGNVVDVDALRRKAPEGDAISGDDGFVYLLESDSLVVLSESGTIVRKLRFTKPKPGLAASRVFVSGGVAVIELAQDSGVGKPFSTEYLAINVSTGETLGLYEPEPELGNNAVCFAATDGLTFWTVKEGKDVLARAPLR